MSLTYTGCLHVPNLMRLFHCLSCTKDQSKSEFCEMFRNIILYDAELVSTRPIPRWRITTCQLSATAYSIYSQLPSTLGAILPSKTSGNAKQSRNQFFDSKHKVSGFYFSIMSHTKISGSKTHFCLTICGVHLIFVCLCIVSMIL